MSHDIFVEIFMPCDLELSDISYDIRHPGPVLAAHLKVLYVILYWSMSYLIEGIVLVLVD